MYNLPEVHFSSDTTGTPRKKREVKPNSPVCPFCTPAEVIVPYSRERPPIGLLNEIVPKANPSIVDQQFEVLIFVNLYITIKFRLCLHPSYRGLRIMEDYIPPSRDFSLSRYGAIIRIFYMTIFTKCNAI